MNKQNLLSRAEMKKVLGGGVPPAKMCDETDGTFYHATCNGMPPMIIWTQSGADPWNWDSGDACGGQCPGSCQKTYVCDEQPVAV